MNPDMDAREVPGTRAGVLLRSERFAVIMSVLGCDSDLSRARVIGVDPKTLYRARRGVIGEELIAKSVDLLQRNEGKLAEFGIRPAFEELFEIGVKPVAERAA